MIGEIPEHWNIRKLRYFAIIQPSNVDKKSVEDQKTIHLCNYLDVYNHEYIDKSIDFMKATASDSQIINFNLKEGDIIITKDSETPLDIAVPAYVPKSLPGIICGYHLAMIRPQYEIAAGEFIFRVFQSESISNQYSSFSNGLTRYGLKVQAIGNALFPLPPLDEQESIIKFLKKKTSEIDAIIVDKQKMIELLQEYRQALISETVTKGLNPKVEMKESGNKWFGEIPKHWEILKIYYLIDFESGKREKGGALNEGVPSLGGENINDIGSVRWKNMKYISEEFYNTLKKGKIKLFDNILVKDGATTGKVAYVNNLENNKVAINEHTYLIRPKKNMRLLNKYLFYIFFSNIIKEQIKSRFHGMIGGVTRDDLRSFITPLSPKSDQDVLINFLDKKFSIILNLISSLKQQIRALNKYRQALISEAVTGKIDVRNYKPNNN